MQLLNIGVFERITSQRMVTIAEVINTLYGINPNKKLKELPDDVAEEASDIRKAITRNIRSLNISLLTVNDEVDADLVFAAAHDFMRQGITPEIILKRGREALLTFLYRNDWEKYMFAFGGRSLVETMSSVRKTGRGQHRKTDEENGTLKMMGALIKLLAAKHPTGKYGSVEKPTISEIYKDVLSLLEKENVSTKGLRRSTFASKSKSSLASFYDDE
ncbi:hypothetical protein [Pantoea dispersa]|uniref:hypothetical protein n=1 Tax=Pantoea dispersa TaxID=59814 RepID=UPI001F51DD52|nr:hypothetical protein [Pantoea dispersa]MCI1029785.1 hypothetical protein [Pantoea dispersa]UYP73333.1 hypothetical protein OF384_18935 [Pantoea dispersa]